MNTKREKINWQEQDEIYDADTIIIIDYGSQYTQLIARAMREFNVQVKVYSCFTLASDSAVIDLLEHHAKNIKGIIVSGGPASTYERELPLCDMWFAKKIPVLGICYGMQLLCQFFGGKVQASGNREYGGTTIFRQKASDGKLLKSMLYDGIAPQKLDVWMSHGDSIAEIPNGFEVVAKSEDSIAAMQNQKRKVYGLQYHPEVKHSVYGKKVLHNFVFKVCDARANWTTKSFVEKNSSLLKKYVGGSDKVILALSGGVDSTVLAVFLQKVLGDRLHCVFIDNGLLRLNERNIVEKRLKERLNLSLEVVDAGHIFLKRLRGVRHPEKKRRIIGRLFIKEFFKVFARYQKKMKSGKIFLAQGTLYTDVIESRATQGPSATIKTHHNLVKEALALEKAGRLIEPFNTLFKDEVRRLGEILGVPKDIINRQPFPGPGMAVRILGCITPNRIAILQQADAIFLEKIREAGLYNKIWQSFCVLLPVRSVGVVGDKRAYGYTIVLRAVNSVDGMTADIVDFSKQFLISISNAIIGMIKQVTRVAYDVSSKPPATIEWE